MEYKIWISSHWDQNSSRIVNTLNYMEKEGQRQIFDNPTTEKGKELLRIGRRIMFQKNEDLCKLEIVIRD